MTKKEYLLDLKARLYSALPADEAQKVLLYYSEYIEDSIENGKSEFQAVSSLLPAAEIVKNILSENTYSASGGNVYTARQQDGGGNQAARQEQSFDAQAAWQQEYRQNQNPSFFAPVSPAPAPEAQRKSGGGGTVAVKTVGLFFYSVIAVPLALAAVITLSALMIVFCAAAGSILIGGIASVIYGFISGIMGKSAMLLFALTGAGFLLTGLGILLILLMKKAAKGMTKGVAAICKGTFRVYGKVLGGKK